MFYLFKKNFDSRYFWGVYLITFFLLSLPEQTTPRSVLSFPGFATRIDFQSSIPNFTYFLNDKLQVNILLNAIFRIRTPEKSVFPVGNAIPKTSPKLKPLSEKRKKNSESIGVSSKSGLKCPKFQITPVRFQILISIFSSVF